MLSWLIAITGMILTILFVIGTHEAAHFFAARLLGVEVLRFSIGFGKTLWQWTDKSGTQYLIALIPLGGYVQMLDSNEGQVPPEKQNCAFNNQPFYKKFLIVLAGPLMNLACAFVLYWLIFVTGFTTIKPVIGAVSPHSIAADAGILPNQQITAIDGKKTATWTGILFRLLAHAGNQDHLQMTVKNLSNNKTTTHVLDLATWNLDGLTPDPLANVGIKPYEPDIPLVIGSMEDNSPAVASKLLIGDKIISVNKWAMTSWEQLITTIQNHPGQTLNVTIKRKNENITLPVTIGSKRSFFFQSIGYLGIAPTFTWPKELLTTIKYEPLAAIPKAWREISDFAYFNALLLTKIITGKLSLKSMGGPITIFESAGSALNSGFLAFIGFLAFLSVSIGIINLLPIPGLDGGHLFIQVIEFIIRRPVPENVLSICYRAGLILLIFVFFQTLMNDLLRLM